MHLFRALAVALRPNGGSLRTFASSPALLAEKYHKITKYAKPIDTTVYKAGDAVPHGIPVPRAKKLYPDYKYETMFFKRQNVGLYAGRQRKRSKTCSEAKNKNLRVHLPNIVKAKLWSEALNKQVRARVSTTLLRTVTKEGGLDNYLLKDTPAREKTMGLKAWRLKYDVIKQRQIAENSVGSDVPVYHVSALGTKITVGRNKLLQALYPFVYRDNYEPVLWGAFLREHSVLTTEELVEKLEHYNFDFSPISV